MRPTHPAYTELQELQTFFQNYIQCLPRVPTSKVLSPAGVQAVKELDDHIAHIDAFIAQVRKVDTDSNHLIQRFKASLESRAFDVRDQAQSLNVQLLGEGDGPATKPSSDGCLLIPAPQHELRGNNLALAASLLAASCHLVFNNAKAECDFILEYLEAISDFVALPKILDFSQSPRDLRTTLDLLGLNIPLKVFVCCPKCYTIYLETPSCPRTCEGLLFDVICGAALFHQNNPNLPRKRFFYRSPIDWLAWALQRPGVENLVDRPKLREGRIPMIDEWDGRFVRELVDDDGSWFFGVPGRYLFSLGLDGFGPSGKKVKRGSHSSVTGIYLELVNFPLHLRDRAENMVPLGLIPGRGEPSSPTGQLNNLVAPIVDDFVVLFKPGIRISRTPNCPGGKHVRAVLGPFLLDLKAARPAGGFVATVHTILCSCCDCQKSQLDEVDLDQFNLRTRDGHREAMGAWLQAASQKERTALEQVNGVRYTDFSRLPYFNGPIQTVHEGLHGTTNAVSKYMEDLFGMNVNAADDLGVGFGKPAKPKNLPSETDVNAANDLGVSSGKPGKTKNLPSEHEFRFAEDLLLHGKLDEVSELPVKTVELLAYSRGIRTGGATKEVILGKLEAWFKREGASARDRSLARRNAHVEVPDGVDTRKAEATLAQCKDNFSDLKKYNLPVLKALCLIRGMDMSAVRQKKPIIAALRDWALENPRLSLYDVDYHALGRRGVVLGHTTLAAYRDLVGKTMLPTHIKPPPLRLGETSVGRITAAEWATIFEISMVLLLVPRWGKSKPGSRIRQLLDNFMDLLAAVKLIKKDNIHPQDLVDFKTYYSRHLRNVQVLFPTEAIRPNDHMLLHDPMFVEYWGPLRGISAWAYEHMNGEAQKVSTNWKFGELEGTIIKRLNAQSMLLALIVDDNVPKPLKRFTQILRTRFTSSINSPSTYSWNVAYRLGESGWVLPKHPTETVAKKDQIWPLLSARYEGADSYTFFFCPTVEFTNRTFRPHTSKSASADGLIFVKVDEQPNMGVGEIRRVIAVFSHFEGHKVLEDILFAVQSYQPLPESLEAHNPFRVYPQAACYLFLANLSPCTLYPASALIGHAIRCKYTVGTFPGIPLVCYGMLVNHLPTLLH